MNFSKRHPAIRNERGAFIDRLFLAFTGILAAIAFSIAIYALIVVS